MKLKELIEKSRLELENNGINDSTIIVKQVVCYVLKIKKEQIIINYENELEDYKIKEIETYITKINEGKPIQYIINNQEFMNLNFYVDENVLIPQPDTEILVENIIKKYKEKKCKILDLCTGSGAIAVSLAKYIENAQIVASDISNKAIQIAKLNAEKNLVHKKIEFIESNMFDKINVFDFDVIVSNPPYIKTALIEKLDKQVKSEPYIALDGGKDGLDFYRIIVNEAPKYLNNDGMIFLEIGYDQKKDLLELIEKNDNYKETICLKDLSNNDRAIISKRK